MTGPAHLSPTVNRFLGRQFLGPLLVCLMALVLVYLTGDLFDRFEELIRHQGFGLIALEYFLLKLPLMVSQLLPAACLAAALLGLGLLSRSGEMLAFQQLGISRLAVAAPLVALALVIAGLNFVLNETLVPVTARQARFVYQVKLQQRKLRGVFANRRIWVRTRGGFVSADAYDPAERRLYGMTFFRLGPGANLERVERAAELDWTGRGWKVNGVLQTFSLKPEVRAALSSFPTLSDLGLKPSDLGAFLLEPSELNVWQLTRYIEGLRRKGLDPGGYVVDRDLKYATPLACFVMVALALALSLDPRPRTFTMGRSFGFAIAIGFAYWVLLGLTSSLGRSGLLPAGLAAWGANLVFSLLAVSLFLWGEEH